MTALYRTQALYNRWANERLYAELAAVVPEILTRPTAVNFGSILAIANHLVLADRLWLNRFTGGEPLPTVDAVPYHDLASLDAARRVEEQRTIALTRDLTPARLAETLAFRTTGGTDMAQPFAICLAHFFNHQTHHRGQIQGLLGAFGHKAADIDLLFFERETGTFTQTA